MSLEFIGDNVLIPAENVFCCVLSPSGQVVMASTYQEDIDTCRNGLRAMFEDRLDASGVVESVDTMTAADWQREYGEKQSKRTAKRLPAVAG